MNTITIVKIVCVRLSCGGDNLYFHTNLPQAIWPFTEKAHFTLSVARGKSKEYVDLHFPEVPFELVEG